MLKLPDPVYRRIEPVALEVFQELGVELGSSFAEFYLLNKGPFGSEKTGLQLLEIQGDCPEYSVLAATRVVRRRFNWPARFLVVSNLVGGGCYVHDLVSGAVFSADFEGGDALMFAGKLEPDFLTFEEFLEWYFEDEF